MCLTLSSTVCFREMRDLLLQIGVQRCAFAWAEGLHGVYNTGLRASSSESNRAKTLCPAQTEQTLEATGPGPMLVRCPFTERHLTHPSVLPRVASFAVHWAQHEGSQPEQGVGRCEGKFCGPSGENLIHAPWPYIPLPSTWWSDTITFDPVDWPFGQGSAAPLGGSLALSGDPSHVCGRLWAG